MKVPLAIAMIALSTSAVADENPTNIFDIPLNSAYFVMDFHDVDVPGRRGYQSVTPTIGVGFSLPGNALLNIEASRKQIVDPIWHGAETQIRIGIGKRF